MALSKDTSQRWGHYKHYKWCDERSFWVNPNTYDVLKCSFCLEVNLMKVCRGCARHCLCANCSEQLLPRNGAKEKIKCYQACSAPNYRDTWQALPMNELLPNELVQCLNQSKDGKAQCEWEGRFGDYDKHCDYDCIYATQECQYCESAFERRDIAEHEEKCGQNTVNCAKCGDKNIEMRHMDEHLAEHCLMTIVCLCAIY